MKITIESTTRIVRVNGVACRVWQGVTERGVPMTALLAPIVAVRADADVTEFEADLNEHAAPNDDAKLCFPLRMVI